MNRWSTMALMLVLLGGCHSSETREPAPPAKPTAQPQKPTPPKQPKAVKPAPKERVYVPRTYPEPAPIQPVKAQPLARAPVKQVVTRLTEVHYDAEALGLRELQYKLHFISRREKIDARASGWWQSGGPPEVKLLQVKRDGKQLQRPGKKAEEVGQNIAWTGLRYQLQKLMDGVGNGFLARRLFDWKKREGTVKLQGKKLQLVLNQEMGKTEVTVGPGHRVLSVTVRSRGIVRSMHYKYRMEQGRNLVSGARLEASVEQGTKLPKRAYSVMKAANGTIFELEYKKAGRYLLPVKLHKKVPGTGQELTLEIEYLSAKP